MFAMPLPRALALGRWPVRPRHRRALAMLAIALLAAAFVLVDRQTMPILLWDESRNVVNALEMQRRGWSLVTTYEGRPDLWNTKPPLVIWMMVASLKLFGTSEFALRLPSMLATLGTLLVMAWFVRRMTGSLATGALAVAIFAASPAAFGEHSGRTADYDAVLLFFTTAALCLGFVAVHRARPRPALVALIAGAALGALFAKGIAGMMPAAGMLLYVVLVRRVARVAANRAWWLAGLGILAPFAAFLVLREHAAPGYLAAFWRNDAAGRFAQSLIGDEKPRFYYAHLLWAGYFSATPLLVLSPLALAVLRGRSRLVLLYALSVTAVLLLVLTFAASKLNHYVIPAMPFMAIAAALTLRALWAWLACAKGAARAWVALSVAAGALPLVGAAEGAVARRWVLPTDLEAAGGYRATFAAVAPLGRPITVVDPGFRLERTEHYAPVLRAYRLIWATRGVRIAHEADPGAVARLHGIVVGCDAGIVPLLRVQGADLAHVPGCAAVLRR